MRKQSKQYSLFSLSSISSPIPSSRRGMELAIGTLVVMILGIILVGGGILLVKMITDKSVTLNDNLNANVQRQLQDSVLRGQLVAVAPSSQVSYGAKDAIYGVRIVNRDATNDNEYTVQVTHAQDNLAQANWSIVYLNTTKVAANDRKDAMIVVGALRGKQVPSGTYTFIVKIFYEDNDGTGMKIYDAPRFFTVLVK